MCTQCRIPTPQASDGEEHWSQCKDRIKLGRNAQDPVQESSVNLRTSINAKQDPFILKFPREISSHISFLSMDATSFDGELKDETWFDFGFKDATLFDGELEKLPTSFILGSVCRGWRLLAWSCSTMPAKPLLGRPLFMRWVPLR